MRLARDLIQFLQTKPEIATNVTEAGLVLVPSPIEGHNAGKATSLDGDVFVDGAEDGKRRHRGR